MRDGIDLGERAVFVVLTLNYQRRHPQCLDFSAERPRPERRRQPDVSPAPERIVHIGVIRRKPLPQIGRLGADGPRLLVVPFLIE